MSYAFEITEMDISHVLGTMGVPCDLETAERLLAEIDVFACERAALFGGDMDDQTDAAHAEIRRQLEAMSAFAPASKPGF